MERTQVNPWTWQDQFGFSQAWRVDGAESVVFLSGQGPISAEGQLVGEGDFEAQVRQVFQNLKAVLEQAGGSLDDVVKVGIYLTDMSKLRDYTRVTSEFLTGPPPASTAVGVTSLAVPGMMVEVEATAVLQ